MSDALSPSVRREARNPNPQSTPVEGAPIEGQGATGEASKRPQANLDDTLQRLIAWYKAARDHWQEWRQEATEMYDLVAGHHWSDEDLDILRDQMRPAITFNRISPFVDVISGLEINNRQETQFFPRQLGAAGVNELLTGAAKWVRDECDAEDEESEAFRDAIICGIGDTQTLMSYDDDPDGLAQIVRVDPLEVLWDPSARKQNLTDARFVLRIKDVPLETAEAAFPDVETQDLHAVWAEDQPDDTRSPHNARLAPYYRIDQAGEIDRTKQMVRMVEAEWWDWEPAWRTIDPSTGRFVRLDEEKARLYVMRARAMGQTPTVLQDRRKVFYKATIGARVLRVTNGPEQGGFTYKAITGRRDRNKGTWYGVVRAMKDPQIWANKFFSQMLHIVNTNAKGGLLAEEDAFVDPDEARDAWAEADSIIMLNPGKIDKVLPKQPPAFPPMIPQMLQFAIEAIPSASGISMEMIAQADRTQPGVLEMQRKQQGMTVLAVLFNALRRYRKEQGRLLLWFIQTFIADGRLIRIGGPEQQQYVPLVHQPGIAEYDVVVDETPTSPNMKDRSWAAMVQIFPMLARMQPPPQLIAEALKYSPLPMDFVNKVSAMMQQHAQQPNGQMQLDQARAAREQAGAALDHARAGEIQARTQMIPSEVQSEASERAARVEHLRAAALNQLQNARLAPTEHALDALNLHLDAQGQAHDQAMDRAGHALNVVQAMQPQQPAAAGTGGGDGGAA